MVKKKQTKPERCNGIDTETMGRCERKATSDCSECNVPMCEDLDCMCPCRVYKVDVERYDEHNILKKEIRKFSWYKWYKQIDKWIRESD